MPICKICNQPILSSITVHSGCFENKTNTNFDRIKASLTMENLVDHLGSREDSCYYCVFYTKEVEENYECVGNCDAGIKLYLESENVKND